jgi:starch-binding outer membrane protein, SusD/RagB family
MQMKKYLPIILLLVLSSCDLIFHEEDNKYIVIDNDQEKIDLLNGIYANLAKVYNNSYFSALTRSDDLNVYNTYSYSDQYGSCGSSGVIDYAEVTGNIYTNFYNAIITINSMLSQTSVIEDPEIMGELYFLRSYSYFQLARLFGTPPLITDTEVKYTVKKPTYLEVYEFIEEEMRNAIDLLPETFADARIPGETPNKGTAKAMLAEIYLSWAGFPLNDKSKYTEAAKYSGEIILQADKYNFGLLDDFADLWKVEKKHNKENIFGLFFDAGSTETVNNINILYFSGSTSYGSESSNYYYYFPMISGQYLPDFKFFNTFPDNYRKYNSMSTGYYYFDSFKLPESSLTALKFIPFDPLGDPCKFILEGTYFKWNDMSAYNGKYKENYTLTEKNEVTLYLLRYAQTLLTYAESSARSGRFNESCYESVNKIRRRANHFDPNSPSPFDLPENLTIEQFLDSVVWERAWELSLEPQGRWFDIVRLDLKDKLPNLSDKYDIKVKVSAELLSDDWYFYLIPQTDRWVSPNYK